MTIRRSALVLFVLVLGAWPALAARAHHGPPHDEIDEFDSPATRLVVPVRAAGISWPAVALSVTAVVVVYAASRKWGIDAPVPVPVRARR